MNFFKKETEEEKFHRLYSECKLTLLEQILEYCNKFFREVIYYIRKIKQLIDWFPYIWNDNDWDANNSLARIIIYKLQRVAPVLENGHTESGPKDAQRMRIVIEHLKRYLYIYKYVEKGDLTWHYEDTDHPCAIQVRINITKRDRYLFDRSDQLEEWHWQEAWRKIAKYGAGWWD